MTTSKALFDTLDVATDETSDTSSEMFSDGTAVINGMYNCEGSYISCMMSDKTGSGWSSGVLSM